MKNNLAYKMMVAIGFIYEFNRFAFSYKTVSQTLYYVDHLDYKIETLRKQFSCLKRDGLIELKTYYRKPYPALTQKGKLAIKTSLSYRKQDAWDGKWRMIIFDIPEAERKARGLLRRKLKDCNFGKLQKSSYISPYPLLNTISRYATELGIRQYLRLIEFDNIDYEKKLIEDIWHLQDINEKYNNFVKQASRKSQDKFWPFRAKLLEQEFASIYNLDPQLPEELLPDHWQGQKAYKVFKKISNSY